MPAALERRTPRERKLLLLVGGVFFLLINLLLVRTLFQQMTTLRTEVNAKSSLLASQNTLLAQAGLWTERANWLQQRVPQMTQGRDRASVDLLNDLETLTRNHGLLLENPPVINPAENTPPGALHRPVSVSIETKGTWNALVRFLHAVQQPERFIVFESASVASDPSDNNLLRGKFRVAKWYGPTP